MDPILHAARIWRPPKSSSLAQLLPTASPANCSNHVEDKSRVQKVHKSFIRMYSPPRGQGRENRPRCVMSTVMSSSDEYSDGYSDEYSDEYSDGQ
jgi:hypothetical protein